MRKAIRLLLTVVSSALGFVVAFYGANPLEKLLNTIFSRTMRWTIIGLSVVVGGILGYVVAPWLIRVVWKAIRWLEGKLRRTPLQDIFYGAIGLIIGLIIANLIGSAFSKVPGIGVIVPIAGSIILGYLGITIAIAKRDDVSGMFTRSGRDRSARTSGSLTTDSSIPKLLDTSVIIDGRIYDVCRTGFLEGPLLVPRFVLDELRHIADSSDMLKRNRGRRGLDVLGKLQKDLGATLQVYERDVATAYTEVDAKLVALAKELGGSVITNDFNLNKVAELQGVRVLNVNDLANSVKPVVLPGEEMRVHVIKDGKEVGQGVGYLDDGTMIVVDGGKRHIGDYIEVIVTSVLQTSAGRMIFARPKTADRATP